jgi:small subunit ribosomal protein S17
MAENTATGNGPRAAVRGRRKTRVGTVVRDKMMKSVVVSFERQITHPLYGKQATRTKTVVAHDEENSAKVGDVVRIMETRPLSKTKRWRLVDIVERAK